jgi:uncharacterized membrane protein
LIFLAVWVVGALPDLTIALSKWDLDGMIMAFFSSIYIYIFFTVYLIVVLYKFFVPRGAIAKRRRASQSDSGGANYEEGALKAMARDIQKFEGEND